MVLFLAPFFYGRVFFRAIAHRTTILLVRLREFWIPSKSCFGVGEMLSSSRSGVLRKFSETSQKLLSAAMTTVGWLVSD